MFRHPKTTGPILPTFLHKYRLCTQECRRSIAIQNNPPGSAPSPYVIHMRESLCLCHLFLTLTNQLFKDYIQLQTFIVLFTIVLP